MSALADEWHQFRADAPGERFGHHYDRACHSSKGARIARLVIGIALIAIGIALLVLPGPGLLVTLFGVALLSAQSKWLAHGLDRAEVWVRRVWRRFRGHA